jgi:hypothetical protein
MSAAVSRRASVLAGAATAVAAGLLCVSAPALGDQETQAAPRAIPPGARDFGGEVRALFRIAACGGDAPVAAELVRAVDRHCRSLARIIDRYRARWLDRARPFLADLVPVGLPERVVYPFGGGDLITALVTFPRAREYTLVSLEQGEDPRVLERLSAGSLGVGLAESRQMMRFLFRSAFMRTEDLRLKSRATRLPIQIVYALVALSVEGYEPVALTFLRLEADGSVRYLSEQELDRDRRGFDSFEIRFRARGDARASEKLFRHIAWDLSDGNLERRPELLAHLAAARPYAAMTKASSYLMWRSGFSRIRDELLAGMVWMVSDSTAPRPEHAAAAGFEQIPYGRFDGPLPIFGQRGAGAFVDLWRRNPRRALPMRFGYPDRRKRAHLLVTRKQ